MERRVDVNYVSKNDTWYEIPSNTRALMNTVFNEGKDNTNNFMKGTFFEMTIPENPNDRNQKYRKVRKV